MTIGAAPHTLRLPELRQDLRLIGASTDRAGNRLWRLYDPVRHRFSALDRKSYVMLEVWSHAASAEEVIEASWRRHAEPVTLEDVHDFAMFLIGAGLGVMTGEGDWRKQFEAAERRRTAYLTRSLHNYLFFRIPLTNPDRFLRATLPYVSFLGTRITAAVLAILALAGLYLVSREWEQFLASAIGLATWSGAASLLVAVVVVKTLHELGHGYTAASFGCRVPAAGVAFILGAPLLFVDVTDSWRLQSQRARLMIDSAGIAVDLAVSIVSTLVWVLLPSGSWRDAAFSLASAGWLTSLAFNLNPFMKFDGYHILADGLSVPNLQDRAMGLATWRTREVLFALGRAPPERVSRAMRTALVAYGWGTWIYRVILFTGIALAVYHYFFKLLGIILFLVEIGYFIVTPIVREVTAWGAMRKSIMSSRRTAVTGALVVAIAMLLVVPWSTTVMLPAVLEPASIARLHVSKPARIVSLNTSSGAGVSVGDELILLRSEQLEEEARLAELKAEVVDLRLSRLASDATDREFAPVLEQERRSLDQTLAGIRREMDQLRVTAPIPGVVTSLLQHAGIGRWVRPSEPLVILHEATGARIRGLVEAGDKSRLRPGMRAKFVPNDILQPSSRAEIATISTANVTVIDQLELAESFGGPVPSSLGPNDRAVPRNTQYRVTARLHKAAPGAGGDSHTEQPRPGVLVVYGDAQSLALRFWNRILMVLVRESGF